MWSDHYGVLVLVSGPTERPTGSPRPVSLTSGGEGSDRSLGRTDGWTPEKSFPWESPVSYSVSPGTGPVRWVSVVTTIIEPIRPWRPGASGGPPVQDTRGDTLREDVGKRKIRVGDSTGVVSGLGIGVGGRLRVRTYLVSRNPEG